MGCMHQQRHSVLRASLLGYTMQEDHRRLQAAQGQVGALREQRVQALQALAEQRGWQRERKALIEGARTRSRNQAHKQRGLAEQACCPPSGPAAY